LFCIPRHQNERASHTKKQDREVLFFVIECDATTSIAAASVAMMMVVMVMMMPAHVVVVMVVVMTHHDQLRQFDVGLRGGRGLVDDLQQRRRIRDRLEQAGEGVRTHDVGRDRHRRGLSGAQGPERRHRPQKSSDLLIHRFSSR
jgi:hypothetical protein